MESVKVFAFGNAEEHGTKGNTCDNQSGISDKVPTRIVNGHLSGQGQTAYALYGPTKQPNEIFCKENKKQKNPLFKEFLDIMKAMFRFLLLISCTF